MDPRKNVKIHNRITSGDWIFNVWWPGHILKVYYNLLHTSSLIHLQNNYLFCSKTDWNATMRIRNRVLGGLGCFRFGVSSPRPPFSTSCSMHSWTVTPTGSRATFAVLPLSNCNGSKSGEVPQTGGHHTLGGCCWTRYLTGCSFFSGGTEV